MYDATLTAKRYIIFNEFDKNDLQKKKLQACKQGNE